MTFHYTYVIQRESTGEYYIGVRKAYESPELRAKVAKATSAALKIVMNRPDVKAKMAGKSKEVHNRPEIKAAKSIWMKAYWAKRRTAKDADGT